MIDYIKGLFLPLHNRYYNGTRRNLYLYCLDNFFSVAFLVILAVYINWIFWIILAVYALLAITYFIYLDPKVDKFAWQHVWRHLFTPSNTARTDEAKLMSEYSKNPTEANKKALEDHFAKKH